ncbi:hypothetical protein B7Z28_02160, partial [Candidatus Saccharibacteria bacterium 32-45-3]
MKNEVDFSPLKNFSKVFLIYIWIKRVRMMLVRLAFLVMVGFIFFIVLSYFTALESAIQNGTPAPEIQDMSYVCGGDTGRACPMIDININAGMIIFMVYFLYLIPFLWMMFGWNRFAQVNHFTLENGWRRIKSMTTIPSFKKRLSYSPVAPIVGELRGMKLMFFSRMYKEGGILRWRERKMDTILMIELPQGLPHIIINARANEKAR